MDRKTFFKVMAGGIASALFLEAKAEPIKFCSARQQAGYAQILLVERNGWEYPIPFEDLRPGNKFRFVDSGVSADDVWCADSRPVPCAPLGNYYIDAHRVV